MKKLLVLSAIVMAFSLNTAFAAEESSREEAIGVGSGLVIGALAGGPIGAFAGAIVGVVVGERFHRQRTGRLQAEADLAQTSEELASLQVAMRNAQVQMAQLAEEADDAKAREALAEGIRFDVLFRTNETDLETDAGAQLAELATLLAGLPNIEVRLDGHADPRGSENSNDSLATARADTVRNALIDAGVPPTRIDTHVHGESQSTAIDGDLDAYAFERRVSVTLSYADDLSALARNQ